LRVGFLGPVGTFSHDAVRTLGLAVDTVALPTIGDVFEALSTGEIDRAVVPIENALEGTVSATLDALIFDHDVLIQGEVVVPIRLHLMARPGVERAAITEVLSYTHALAQCRHFLAELAVATVAVASTADAARLVAAGEVHSGGHRFGDGRLGRTACTSSTTTSRRHR
jgi:prephenate dehydratase